MRKRSDTATRPNPIFTIRRLAAETPNTRVTIDGDIVRIDGKGITT